MAKGLIHYYYGLGKGKTTAALGLMTRALGYGRKIVLVQFLKGRPTGEIHFFAAHTNVTILRCDPGMRMTLHMDDSDRQQTKRRHDENLSRALALINAGQCDLLVLDEVSDAHKLGLLDETLLHKILSQKPDALEIVMTGHEAIPYFLDQADYVTEMVKHKHPFEKGIPAREGIEY